MRVVTFIVLSFAAGSAHAQERPDEVVVRGRQVGELRVAMQNAREHAYSIFNEINSTDDFDVLCREETRYFSHAKQRVCRPRFEGRISGQAAKEFLSTLTARCQPDEAGGAIPWQSCMFGGVGQGAKSNAQAVEGQAPPMHQKMNDEILRLAETDQRFGQAILDFFEASQEYDAARGRRADEDED